jgi:hypothetical protein
LHTFNYFRKKKGSARTGSPIKTEQGIVVSRKLRKSLKLVADKKNIPRKRWQQQCGLLGGGGQQQQQRSLQSEELAHGRALSLWTHVFFLKP